ncbi:alcohol dehydrogenase catalytic domain-containing protein [Vibrio mediterranei]|uniref:alcohol dehydrogenase catalytic domain-containing protein n=1 Tax=Vibrio mediterranei TaxID=689 RepID=UPI001EFE2D96|nr:alcohol dehydrogenase catalytic domain-containing protein [Vibrio mediterranei]MCG9625225.1 alcohol dehydrogenase catalytic domain-containing protein [Vibrio mediterranei]
MTYRAMQISQPGKLELVERQVPTPSFGEVIIKVEACGICGADIFNIDGIAPNQSPPRIPGHEVVGRIISRGQGVSNNWQVGQKVGVGRLGGPCLACDSCRAGHFQQCSDQPVVGSSMDGGYAEMMRVRSSGLVSMPESLSSVEAAPMLCAGIATFNALKKCGAEPCDTVANLGIGGLGHMAIQYAQRMGYRVLAIGIEGDVLSLGAHHYIDTNDESITEVCAKLEPIQVLIATINHPDLTSQLTNILAPKGQVMILGVGAKPLVFRSGALVDGETQILGSITGTPFENEKALKFSVLTDIRPRIETMPFEQANEAFQKMKSGDVNFRMVLTMK